MSHEVEAFTTPCLGAGDLDENAISRHIVDAAIEVHRTLGGPGLLESVYEEALVWELEQRGLVVRRQVSLPIPYKGIILAHRSYRGGESDR
ncbi:MAG: GxxExxY protein [Candidatus Hydrogenedentales bacterium]|jgi:GxxExxY protein